MSRILLLTALNLGRSCSKSKTEPEDQYRAWLLHARPVKERGERVIKDVTVYFVDPVRGRRRTHLHVIAPGCELDQRVEPQNGDPHIEVWKTQLAVGDVEIAIWVWADVLERGQELLLKCDTSKGDYLVVRSWEPDPSTDVHKTAPLFK